MVEESEAWMEKARRNLAAARLLVGCDEPKRDIAVYHCQQAAEKALKAVLTARRQAFPRTHDLEALLELLATVGLDGGAFAGHAMILNPYAVEFTYPGDVMEPNEEDAKEAIELAEEIWMWAAQVMSEGSDS